VIDWVHRPDEEAYLLNPAFLALLLREMVKGYSAAVGAGMPLPLVYVAMPVVLHRPTRDVLPRSVLAEMVNWVDGNPQVRLLFADRAKALVPFVREGLVFGTLHGLLAFDDGLTLRPTPRRVGKVSELRGQSADFDACIRASGLIGRWTARSGSAATQMALWGVKP
jgi:hypothetical protein